jgi:hypothetical protein
MRRIKSSQSHVRAAFAAFLGAGLFSWGCGSDAPNDEQGGGLVSGGAGGSLSGAGAANGKGGKGGSIITGGAAGSAGGSATGGSSGSGAASGSGSLDPDAACSAVSRESSKAVVALYFMVDISGSMKCEVPEPDPSDPCEVDPGDNYADRNRWTDSRLALKSFFSSSASGGMWAGIGFFPSNGSCDPDDYADPVSEIAELPAAAATINGAIDDQEPNGQTPTVPSLQGAVDHAREWATAHPDHTPVVVYLTDGYPRGCGERDSNTITNAAQIAEAAFDGTPSVRTYVLAVGPNLGDLNAIAVAGGTDAAVTVDTGADVTAQLTNALAQIRDDVVIECTYTIPAPPAGQTLEPGKVNVRYTSGGTTTDIGYNPTTSTCTEGWQYSADGKQIILCGDTCTMVKAAADASIDVLFGCTTKPIDPR